MPVGLQFLIIYSLKLISSIGNYSMVINAHGLVAVTMNKQYCRHCFAAHQQDRHPLSVEPRTGKPFRLCYYRVPAM